MGSKSCLYMLRTVERLQSHGSLVGLCFLKCKRNHSLKAAHPVLSDIHTLQSSLRRTTVPIRCLNHESSLYTEGRNVTSSLSDGPSSDTLDISDIDNVKLLNQQISLKPNVPENIYKQTKLHCEVRLGLSKCTTPREVLDIFPTPSYRKDELFQGVMKLWHTFLALDKKQKLIERMFVIHHPHFHNLSHGIMKTAAVMTPAVLVRILHVFIHLNINQQSLLIQNLLCVCQERLTMFNEEELAILANSLERLQRDSNVDLLKYGLRLLMDIKIEEVNDVTPFLIIMKALGRTAPLNLKLKLEKKALQMIDKFTVAHSQKMFCILVDINFYSESLLNACSCKITDNIDELPFIKIIRLLSCCYEMLYYNERLMTTVGDHILKTMCIWKPWQVAVIVQYLAHLRFRHVPLLDRYADILMQNLESLRIWDLSLAVQSFAMLNHLPEGKGHQFLAALNTVLQKHIDDIPLKDLLNMVHDFCMLGKCPRYAVNKLLHYQSFSGFKAKGQSKILSSITMCLMVEEPISNSHSLWSLKKAPSPTSEGLQTFHTFFQHFIKDPRLYLHSLQIAGTYYIDFIVSLDTQENNLVPVGDMWTEKPQTADNPTIVRIAVICCTRNAFALGSFHPLGKLAVKIQHLKSLAFSVVVVPVNWFIKMNEEQKAEFLRTKIFRE
ncbi:FAST kinase domain-containing protein 2, mitochondrial isoform X1 [Hyperolius riggenbachi]|uniref:FAST kinase domain-containing protein 2, mitochondrial isoform X1 n=1 Tax=Hyperolius riggenbachi TaxID=752182 RepID=UPI0035A2E2D5